MAMTPTAGVNPSDLPTQDPIGQDRWDTYDTIKKNNYTPALALLPGGLDLNAAQQMSFNYSKGVWAKNLGGGPGDKTLGPGPKANLGGGSSSGASNTSGSGNKGPAPAAPGAPGGNGGNGGDAGIGGGPGPGPAPAPKKKDQQGNSFSINSSYRGGDFNQTLGDISNPITFGNNSYGDSGAQQSAPPSSVQGLQNALGAAAGTDAQTTPLAAPGNPRNVGQRMQPPLSGLLKALVY